MSARKVSMDESSLTSVNLFTTGHTGQEVLPHDTMTGSMHEHLLKPSKRLTKSIRVARIREQGKLCNILFWIIVVLTLLGVVLILYFLFGNDLYTHFVREVRELAKSRTPLSIMVLVLVQLVFAVIPFLPGLSTYNIMQAFFLHDFPLSFAISFGGCYLGSLLVFLLTKSCFHQRVYKKFKGLIIYKILLKETKKKPIQTGIMFNFLFVPVSVKNYLIGISELRFYHCLVVFPPGHSLLCALCAMIGAKMNDLSDLMGAKGFSEKTRAEKLQIIVSGALLVFTVAFFITLFFVIRRKYKRYEEDQLNRLTQPDANAGGEGEAAAHNGHYDRENEDQQHHQHEGQHHHHRHHNKLHKHEDNHHNDDEAAKDHQQ